MPTTTASELPPQPLLRVENLSVRRNGVRILRNVTWQVLPGERWVILGANGSGKTSLLSALAGFLPSSEGVIDVLGNRYGDSDWQKLRQQIGMVSSTVRQRIEDTESALEVIASGLFGQINYWGHLKKADILEARRFARLARCAQILQRPWAVLSQGERQRVLIGRALAARPKLLILDEPCAGLDPAAREHFLAFIDKLARLRKGPALVFVTHHIEEIGPAFTHVLALKNGAVLAADRKENVLTSAMLSQVFTAKFEVVRTAERFELTLPQSTPPLRPQ